MIETLLNSHREIFVFLQRNYKDLENIQIKDN